MRPYFERAGITIYHGRCEDILPTLADKSVDIVLTDPPFNARFDYGNGHDDNLPWPDYTEQMAGIIGECERISNGMVLVFVSVTGLIKLTAVKPPRWVASWTKPVGGTHSSGNSGFFPRWEPCLVYGRTWGEGGRVPPGLLPDAWYVMPTRPNGHPCPKPVELIREILHRHPAHLILDPFMGSGTTLRAALDLGKRAIGIEQNEEYCEIAVKRLSQMVLPLAVRV